MGAYFCKAINFFTMLKQVYIVYIQIDLKKTHTRKHINNIVCEELNFIKVPFTGLRFPKIVNFNKLGYYCLTFGTTIMHDV